MKGFPRYSDLFISWLINVLNALDLFKDPERLLFLRSGWSFWLNFVYVINKGLILMHHPVIYVKPPFHFAFIREQLGWMWQPKIKYCSDVKAKGKKQQYTTGTTLVYIRTVCKIWRQIFTFTIRKEMHFKINLYIDFWNRKEETWLIWTNNNESVLFFSYLPFIPRLLLQLCTV